MPCFSMLFILCNETALSDVPQRAPSAFCLFSWTARPMKRRCGAAARNSRKTACKRVPRTAFEPEGEDKLRRALAEHDEKIAQVEAQIADAFKSTEVAEADQGDEGGD